MGRRAGKLGMVYSVAGHGRLGSDTKQIPLGYVHRGSGFWVSGYLTPVPRYSYTQISDFLHVGTYGHTTPDTQIPRFHRGYAHAFWKSAWYLGCRLPVRRLSWLVSIDEQYVICL